MYLILQKKKGINSINKFFNRKNLNNLEKFVGNTDIIFGANVVCHIPDLVEFILTCNLAFNENGKIIFEEPYLGSMYQKVSYDQIYDEHIFLFSINSIKKIFNIFDFELIDVLPQNTHGGSMRYVLERKRSKINKKVKNFIELEKRQNIDSLKGAAIFKKKCELSKEKLQYKLAEIKRRGKAICGYGATSKSTTILNYCNIKSNVIDCIFDTTPNKIGKFSPGVHIPIVDYRYFKKKFYEYSFLFAWNHKNEIEKKETSYLGKGGKWITHL